MGWFNGCSDLKPPPLSPLLVRKGGEAKISSPLFVMEGVDIVYTKLQDCHFEPFAMSFRAEREILVFRSGQAKREIFKSQAEFLLCANIVI